MSSIRNLKKEINHVLGDILDAAELSLELAEGVTQEQADAFSEDVYATYDKLIENVNNKKVENRKVHIKAVKKEFEEKANSFVEQINAWK